jgi:hypothetical protein
VGAAALALARLCLPTKRKRTESDCVFFLSWDGFTCAVFFLTPTCAVRIFLFLTLFNIYFNTNTVIYIY